ncbi:tRNA-splicing endonuclease subunit Sen2 [Discoglossus pictus]
MAQATFNAPRRKRKVYESYESPFPIPLSHDFCAKDFRTCQAEIINNFVIVRNPEDMALLYSKGYFGKGIMSRSRPEYNMAELELAAKWRGSHLKLPVISSRKYQRHVEWAKGLLEDQGLSPDSIINILEDYTRTIDLPIEEESSSGEPTSDSRTEGMDYTESSDPEGTASPVNVDQNQDLEGNPLYDPLAKYGSEIPDTGVVIEEPDRETLEKSHCHKHDDFIGHCGCKPEKMNLQKEPESLGVGEHGHEYVMVQEEEDSEENVVQKGKLVCRRNPFKLFEYLQLSREEAFFLVYALGCLSVHYNKEPLTIVRLWEVFGAAQPRFQPTYIAYHHFRSKGWVPKVGLKYGTDLLLYRKGPPFYHASYSVIVEMVNDNFEGQSLRPLTWRTLAGLNRTTVNVSKELLFCYLIRSSDFTEKDLSSPECIKKIQVQELVVSRWISSRERMEQDEL